MVGQKTGAIFCTLKTWSPTFQLCSKEARVFLVKKLIIGS